MNTMLLKIAPVTAATAISIAAALSLFSGAANAQTSLCFERCTAQYGWPQQQCAQYCRRRDAAAPRSYGYTRPVDAVRGYGGGCGEFKYWNGNACVDARDKPAK